MNNDPENSGLTPDLERLQREKEAALERLSLREAEIEALSEELRDAMHLLTEARDRYADLFEFAPVGYVTLTGQGNILEGNSTFATMLGLDSRTLLNTPFNVLLASTADIHQFLGHLRLCRERGSKCDSEIQLKHRDGSLLHAQLSSIPTADYASRTVVFRTAVMDITERKQAELARDETRRQIQTIMDAAPVPIGYLNREQRFVFVNGEYLRKFRFRKEGVLGQSFREVHGANADLFGDRFERCLAGEPSIIESYMTCQHTGELFFLRVHIAPDCSAGDGSCGIVIIATDLTDQKRVLEELQYAKESADRANRAKSQFLANMSHELRTPMNGVLGMIQLALEGYAEPLASGQRDLLSKAFTAGKSLLRILNDILDLSRVEAGTLAIEQSPFDLRKCVGEAVAMFADESRQKGVDLGLAVADDVPDNVTGDYVRLRQVMINLIGNAVKFTDRGNVRVEVTAASRKPEEARIVFVVSDTGIGIPEDKKALLFQPFSQVDPSHTRQYGGTGIGLSISKKIIRMMGGQISFDSTEGVGSWFSFVIPLPEAEQAPHEPPPEPEQPETPAPAPGQAYRVLVAEDDSMSAELLKEILELKGLEMDLARTGREAFDRWEQGQYDLVIMDVQMPKMDGLTATRHIRERERERGGHIPILAMTAHANKEEEELCLNTGMDAFMSKPLDLKKGLELVMTLIKRNKAPSISNS